MFLEKKNLIFEKIAADDNDAVAVADVDVDVDVDVVAGQFEYLVEWKEFRAGTRGAALGERRHKSSPAFCMGFSFFLLLLLLLLLLSYPALPH